MSSPACRRNGTSTLQTSEKCISVACKSLVPETKLPASSRSAFSSSLDRCPKAVVPQGAAGPAQLPALPSTAGHALLGKWSPHSCQLTLGSCEHNQHPIRGDWLT